MSELKRFCKKLYLLCAVLILNPALNLTAQTSKDTKFDMGAYHLHAIIAGSEAPTVVFESGMGEDLSTWKDVQPVIAKSARTFTYDRAGLGQSDPSPHKRDAIHMAKELHSLLHKAKVRGPYVLVGHSLGGWIVSIFAHLYPKEVAGLVLVDPAYQESILKAKSTAKEWADREQAILKYTPPMSKYQQLEKDNVDLSGEQSLRAFPVSPVPTILLTGTLFTPGFPLSATEKEVKLQVHQDWIKKAPWTEQVFVSESRHYIQNEAPAKVISAIELVLEKARKNKQ